MHDEVYSPVKEQGSGGVPLPELPPPEVEYMIQGLSRSIHGHLGWTPWYIQIPTFEEARQLVLSGLDEAQEPNASWVDFKVVRCTTKCEYLNIETGEPG